MKRLLLFVGSLLLSVACAADITGIATSPSGSNGDVQINKTNRFGSDPALNYNSTTKVLAVPFVNTGQGGNKLYPMNQDLTTGSSPTFSAANIVGNMMVGGVLTASSTYASSASTATYLSNVANVKSFGALGDGSADDTSAIQAAVNTGLPVYFPGVASYYKISSPISGIVSGQRVFGDGRKSKIVQSGTGANASVFSMDNVTGVSIEKLYVVPSTYGVVSSIYWGSGFIITNSTGVMVSGCEVSGHIRPGVYMSYVNRSRIVNNYIHDSLFDPVNYDYTYGSSDIALSYGGSGNVIGGNTITNGCSQGIGIQTIISGNVMNGNVIADNTIDGEASYGVIAYRMNTADSMLDNVISGNSIRNISGLTNYVGIGRGRGAGIYALGQERVSIIGNTISNCNASTDTNLLYPGCICANGMGQATITGNSITGGHVSGISVSDPNGYRDSNGAITVSGNTITKSPVGVWLNQAQYVSVTGNVISSFTTTGISANLINGLSVSANSIYASTNTGIAVYNSTDTLVSWNRISGVTTSYAATANANYNYANSDTLPLTSYPLIVNSTYLGGGFKTTIGAGNVDGSGWIDGLLSGGLYGVNLVQRNTDGAFEIDQHNNSTTPTNCFRAYRTGIIAMAHYGAGAATFDASGNISSVSDERAKDRIVPFTGGLTEILSIHPVKYHYNEKSGLDTKEVYTGFTTQDVGKTIPEAVFPGKDGGFDSLWDRAIMAAMVNAIKSLNEKIAILNKRILALEKKKS